jgi:DNA-binding transcriptional LysR family regulator
MEEMVAPVASPAFLKTHPIAKGEDLLRLPLLHMASRPGAWTHWFESLGVTGTPAQGMRFEQFGSVAQACIAGLGVALMPLFLIDSELASGQLVEAFPHQVRSPSAYYAVAPASKANFRPVVAFRAWLLEEVGRYGEEVVGW